MSSQVCVHTNDKLYSIIEPTKAKFSSIDYTAPIAHSTKFNDLSISKRVWSGDEVVYWKMETDYPYIEGRKLEEETCKLAFLETSMRTNLVIRQQKRSTGDAQIKINWLGKKDESYFTDNILAFAFGPQNDIGGNITMNADNPWGLFGESINAKDFEDRFDRPTIEGNTYKVYDALHTMKHEGGHAVGMPHLEGLGYRDNVMFPFYNGSRRFGSGDLDTLWKLYQKASFFHKTEETILARIGKGVMG